jgi:hypothetical protein
MSQLVLRSLIRFAIDCLEPFSTEWLDSAKVARRARPERFAKTGYGLANITGFLGIEFKHHDALEDARGAGEVILSAMRATDMSFHEMRICAKRGSLGVIVQAGNPNGSLYGEVVVFTGALSIGTQKGPPIGVQKGPLSFRVTMTPRCFFVRLKGAVSLPRPDHSKASRAAAVKHGRQAIGGAGAQRA